MFSESDGHRVSSSVFVSLFLLFLHRHILYSLNRQQHWGLLLTSGAQCSCVSTATLLIPEALKTCPVTESICLSNNVLKVVSKQHEPMLRRPVLVHGYFKVQIGLCILVTNKGLGILLIRFSGPGCILVTWLSFKAHHLWFLELRTNQILDWLKWRRGESELGSSVHVSLLPDCAQPHSCLVLHHHAFPQ